VHFGAHTAGFQPVQRYDFYSGKHGHVISCTHFWIGLVEKLLYSENGVGFDVQQKWRKRGAKYRSRRSLPGFRRVNVAWNCTIWYYGT